MQLKDNYRLIDRVDVSALSAYVDANLRPLFDAPDRLAWETVQERSKWIGRTSRPTDIGYRKMRPTGYMQLCVLNDESPYSPWALPLSSDLAGSEELQRLLQPIIDICPKHYGEGVLYFCVFAVLAPKGVVPPHVDMPHDINKKQFSHHLHIPLTSASSTEFMVGGEIFKMAEGGVYEINNMVVHSVMNRGEDYRVNLMLDYCATSRVDFRNSPSPATAAGAR